MTSIDRIAREFYDLAPSGRVPERWAKALSAEEGVRVQIAVQEIHDRAGDRRVGWKVAATNPVVQKQLGISEPGFGSIRQSRVYQPGELSLSGLQQPHAECELCFELAVGIKDAETLPDVAKSVSKCFAAFEIIEKRVAIAQGNFAMALADNAEHTAIVLGEFVRASDLTVYSKVRCELRVNDNVIGTAAGDAVLGHPLNSILWLKDALKALGQKLEPGMLVMTGSFLRQQEINAGDVFEARFTGVGAVNFLAAA
jgi:2-keto-4-pentenoate hydratase